MATSALTLFLSYIYVKVPKRNRATGQLCLGRSREMTLTLYEYVQSNNQPVIVYGMLAFGFLLVLAETLIYIGICIHLYFHDQGMKAMLPGATLKKRNRKNALDLAGNILSFVMDTMFLILASLNIQSLNISHHSKIFLNLLALSGYSTYCFCQILLSSTLQLELLNFLDTVLLIPLISRMLVFLNYIGLMPSQCLQSVHDLRGRYLS